MGCQRDNITFGPGEELGAFVPADLVVVKTLLRPRRRHKILAFDVIFFLALGFVRLSGRTRKPESAARIVIVGLARSRFKVAGREVLKSPEVVNLRSGCFREPTSREVVNLCSGCFP